MATCAARLCDVRGWALMPTCQLCLSKEKDSSILQDLNSSAATFSAENFSNCVPMIYPESWCFPAKFNKVKNWELFPKIKTRVGVCWWVLYMYRLEERVKISGLRFCIVMYVTYDAERWLNDGFTHAQIESIRRGDVCQEQERNPAAEGWRWKEKG